MHSPCYYFAISSPGEGGRCGDKTNVGDGPAALLPTLSAKGVRAQLRVTLSLLRVLEGRAASLTLGALLSLADNDGNINNSNVKGGKD